MTRTQHVAQGAPKLQGAECRRSRILVWVRFVFSRVLLHALAQASLVLSAFATCTAPKNAIEAENCLAGTPSSQWYVDGAGSPNIQGFATDISVNAGQIIFFKISTNAASYRIDIYRLGYYQGNDGRFVASISPSAPLPQIQPPCLTDSSTGLTDCGNWAISASWTVPSTAMSGIYFAELLRLDTGEASPIIFVVRNDSSHSNILVQTSDTTWQAYNDYGGNSLYSGNPVGRAYKVSYNRPVNTLKDFFSNEFNMIRWLEANGYDVSYSAGVDTERNGALITQHRIFMSVGHDEYWSGGQRANVEAARDAGANLAFFSGNEIFWKTRWEPSIDGSNTPYRTLVCYKETLANAVIDPADPPTWTGLWRDPRFSPPADGGRPENALSGTIFAVDAPRNDAITVPQDDGRMRFWRNTSMATLGPGQVATLPTGVLGYEWDIDADNGLRPAGLIRLSTTTVPVPTYLYYSPSSGYYFGNANATHHLTLYRAPSGALVFGAGTIHWSQGVENDHGGFSGVLADPNAKQATVNLLADMGVQPATLQSGLTPATASTDTTPPRSAITSPAPGSKITAGTTVTISGTAADSGGGVVGAIEISLDGGKTWHPAAGRENWTYSFTPGNSGTLNVQSRAVDDSGNLEVPSPGITVTAVPQSCPCTIWPSTAAPANADAGPYSPLELGVQFRADASGYVTGIRFYKSTANTGTHVGNLWNSSGALLASATFTGESSSGWQQVSFSNPVAIAANTVYVASYHTTVGHFSMDQNYFVTSGVDNAPLHAPASGGGGANGVYAFASTSAFPANAYNASNFWVDLVFNTSGGTTSLLSVGTASLPNGTQSAAYNQSLPAVGGAAPYSWSLFSGALPSGLTLSTNGQISGTPTTLGVSNFTVQVTDSSVPAQAATQALSITVVGPIGSQNNAELKGDYALTFSGINGSSGGSSVFGAVGRFTADGAGNVTNGELDTNSPGAVLSAQSFTGTYAIGADNRGVMTLNIGGGSTKLAFAMMANGNAKFTEFDAAGGSGRIGSGSMEKADTAAYNTAKIVGDYAFGAAGLDNLNNRATMVGRFTASGAGALTNAAGDLNAYGSVNSMTFSAASYTVADSSTGRGTMHLAFLFGGSSGSLNFVFYVVNAGKLFAMVSDPVTTSTPLLHGVVLQQQSPAGGFSDGSLNGNMVIYLTGLSTCGSGSGGVPKAVAGLFTADGNGSINLTFDENFCRAPNSVNGLSGTYSVASNGRTSITAGTAGVVAYLVSLNRALLFSTDSSVLFGFGEPQAAGSFTNNEMKGTYAGFTTAPVSFGMAPFSGEFTADGASPTGTISGTEDIGAATGPNPGVAFNATFSISSSPTNGRGTMTVTSGSGGSAVVYVISPSKFVAVPLSDPNPAVLIFEQPPALPTLSLSSVTLNPTSVIGGLQSSTGTVTMSGPAPAGGAQVALSSSNAAASVPSSVTVPVGASSVTFTVSTSAVTASTPVTITASFGGATNSALLTLTPQPNYVLSAAPSSLSITQGTRGTSTVTIAPQNGFNGSVNLSASGLPTGVTASFSPNPATTTSTLTLATGNTATTGTATVTITGSSGSLTHTTTITLTVTAAPNYSLSASPTSLSITQATSGTSTVTVAPQNGFSGNVSLSASGLPSGVTASFSPNPATTTSTLTLTASNTATTGTATVTITGSSGSLTHTTTITLTVTPPPLPTVSSLTLDPANVIGGSQSSGTVTLSGPAPAGGAQVLLSSSNGAARVPSSVTVPAGATSATFTVNTSIVLLSTSTTISASYNGTTKSATLGILL
jgi:hypothetical protein